MSPILVTGGAGFIGGNFVLRHFDAVQPSSLINLDALTYAGNPDTIASLRTEQRHVFVHGSINDAELVWQLLADHQPRAIINFAAESHVDRSIDGPSAFVETNVNGTLNLLEQSLAYWRGLDRDAREDFRFLHVSTDEVYGSLGSEGAFTETTAYAPNSPYAASKAASDHLVRAFNRTYGLPTLITNCSNNYGPYQFPEKLIPLIILRALAGESLPIYGDGQQIRDWLYVGDHCSAIRAVLEEGRPGQVYNVGGNAERANLDVVHAICSILDELRPRDDGQPYSKQVEHVTDRPGHDRRYAIDASKLKNELGWTPSYNFRDGLRETIDWYLENQDWVGNIQDGSYRQERLGLTQYK